MSDKKANKKPKESGESKGIMQTGGRRSIRICRVLLLLQHEILWRSRADHFSPSPSAAVAATSIALQPFAAPGGLGQGGGAHLEVVARVL